VSEVETALLLSNPQVAPGIIPKAGITSKINPMQSFYKIKHWNVRCKIEILIILLNDFQFERNYFYIA
jgi:hypothetical protein